tara:strand:- start:1409 stop:2125 length:717 start_codon:yes stop_codon:yes gene_type:complete
MALRKFQNFLKNIESDIFRINYYPNSDLKSYHLKYWLTFIVNLYLKFYHRVDVTNPEYIPKLGAGVIASNHMSHLDGIIINAVTAYHTRRKINFLAAEDVYNKNFLFRFLCDLGNTIPVQRSTSDRVALLKVIKLLKKDNLVGLFPEGQRSRDGKIGEGKMGVAIMALKTGTPIIPLAINGTFQAFPRKTKMIKPEKVKLKFGSPLKFSIEKKPDKKRIEDVTKQIMNEIKKLYNDIN